MAAGGNGIARLWRSFASSNREWRRSRGPRHDARDGLASPSGGDYPRAWLANSLLGEHAVDCAVSATAFSSRVATGRLTVRSDGRFMSASSAI